MSRDSLPTARILARASEVLAPRKRVGIADVIALESVACDLCGSQQSRPVLEAEDDRLGTSPERFTIVECLNCGLRYTNPRPQADDAGRFYPVDRYGDFRFRRPE